MSNSSPLVTDVPHSGIELQTKSNSEDQNNNINHIEIENHLNPVDSTILMSRTLRSAKSSMMATLPSSSSTGYFTSTMSNNMGNDQIVLDIADNATDGIVVHSLDNIEEINHNNINRTNSNNIQETVPSAIPIKLSTFEELENRVIKRVKIIRVCSILLLLLAVICLGFSIDSIQYTSTQSPYVTYGSLTCSLFLLLLQIVIVVKIVKLKLVVLNWLIGSVIVNLFVTLSTAVIVFTQPASQYYINNNPNNIDNQAQNAYSRLAIVELVVIILGLIQLMTINHIRNKILLYNLVQEGEIEQRNETQARIEKRKQQVLNYNNRKQDKKHKNKKHAKYASSSMNEGDFEEEKMKMTGSIGEFKDLNEIGNNEVTNVNTNNNNKINNGGNNNSGSNSNNNSPPSDTAKLNLRSLKKSKQRSTKLSEGDAKNLAANKQVHKLNSPSMGNREMGSPKENANIEKLEENKSKQSNKKKKLKKAKSNNNKHPASSGTTINNTQSPNSTRSNIIVVRRESDTKQEFLTLNEEAREIRRKSLQNATISENNAETKNVQPQQ